jgi:predicted nucleic acid-binding protein
MAPMTTYVLDSSAIIHFVDDKAGAERVEEILSSCVARKSEISISAIQWGEAAVNLRKRLGPLRAAHIMSSVLPNEAMIVPVTGQRAVHAAALRVDYKISYADAFAVDLAMDSPDCVLVTADDEFKTAEKLIRIEFLPLK